MEKIEFVVKGYDLVHAKTNHDGSLNFTLNDWCNKKVVLILLEKPDNL